MALINCKECAKEISDQAKACPHCGITLLVEPTTQVTQVEITSNNSNKTSGIKKNIIPVALILVVVLVISASIAFKSIQDKREDEASSILIKDFNTRLTNLSLDNDSGELAEISVMLIGAKHKAFESLAGWYYDKDYSGQSILVKKIRLDGRSVDVELVLSNNKVIEVGYSYDNAVFEDFANYISYSHYIIDDSLSISAFIDGTSVDVVDEDAATTLLANAVGNNEKISLYYSMDYALDSDRTAKIQCYFSYYPTVAGTFYISSTRFY